MSSLSSPLDAVIPTYNMAAPLGRLLPELLEQEYRHVYVLDDASRDSGETRDVVSQYGAQVILLAGNTNVGPGANRNRILDHVDETGIIHFIDADMEVTTPLSPELADDLLADQTVGLVGGLITEPGGRQVFYNYGPRFAIGSLASMVMQAKLDNIGRESPARAIELRNQLGHLLRNWPNTEHPPYARDTHWVCEGNMIIAASTFKRLGGFNPKLRSHEIQYLVARMDTSVNRLRRRFDPSFATKHNSAKNGSKKLGDELKAVGFILRKYGVHISQD